MRLAAQHLLRAYGDRHPDFEEILSRSVDTIIRQTEALKRIAGEFSAFARLPTRDLRPVGPASIAREVAGLYQGDVDITVVEEIQEAPEVLADEDELRRILVNLTTNAVEAMQDGGGTLTLGIRKARAALGGVPREVVEVIVRDTGVGIPPTDLARLFEPNFSTKTGGTGLGLAITRTLVEAFGGEIEVASTPGEGTTVTVRLPPA
jgi:signal transduction histidine kinase